jgi:aminoglycoside/choline kinase family phosphotransferase
MKGGIIMARHSNAGRKTSPHQMPESDARLAQIAAWLRDTLHLPVRALQPASADASFRRYFRAYLADGTYIVMDAPPQQEDVRPYLKVTALLEPLGVHVPHVHEHDAAQGLLLLEDLGTTQYLTRLEAGDDPEPLYADALAALARIQVRGAEASLALAPYGRAELLRELSLMPEWFLGRHLRATPPPDAALVAATFEFLISEALAQPAVFVHRDFHSRNLMLTRPANPGVIDFQDALRGPIGYDLVSLLKDCYISWPRARVEGWVRDYRLMMHKRGALSAGTNDAQMLRWFDVIGIQRHLKVLGIFCRLWYRDGKSGYLNDLPLTLQYVVDACGSFPQLAGLRDFLLEFAVPGLPPANSRALPQVARA